MRELLEALVGRVVTEPQDELATSGVDEPLHLLGHLGHRADEVVAHVLLGIAVATPQVAAVRRSHPRGEVTF